MSTEIVKTNSERFIDRVMMESRATTSSPVILTEYQRGIVQGYFVTVDTMLKNAEVKRQAQVDAGFRNASPVPYDWNHINLNQLALDCLTYSKMGLDSQAKNHIYPIAYFNKRHQRYDIGWMVGYRGLGYIAKRYGIDPPENIVCELVYSTDKFSVIKKGSWDDGDKYSFEITNPFERGDIVGGFAYFSYADHTKNRVYTISRAELDKRKNSDNISFWGGMKDVWKDRKKVGQEKVEGWPVEMYFKTVCRWAYGKVELDPQKIDENMQYMRKREQEMIEVQVMEEVEENAGTVPVALPEQPELIEAEPEF